MTFQKKFKQLFFCSILLLLLVISSLFPGRVFSAEFSTGYDIKFTFDTSGRAHVVQKISLKNKTDDLYASEYTLTIGSNRVSEVAASDRLGGVPVSTLIKDQSTSITAKMNDKVVGLGKVATLTINYTIDDLALKHGLIWEVNIPKIVTQEEVDSYSLRLSIPESFGSLHSIVPTPGSTESGSGQTTYVFDKNAVSYNISSSFGKVQQFKFDLKYRLKNNNILSGLGTIALPPDTNQQQIFLKSISPSPKRLYSDADGNFLADFLVKGRSNLEISVAGYVKISDQTEELQKVKETDQETLAKYLKADKYWETQDAAIQKKAKELSSIGEIYKFVTTNLKYNYNRLEQSVPDRFGAAKALQNPTNAICTDFTDLFIALARAKGIPAREIEGYAYSDNANTRPIKVGGLEATNILHAWPEYFDKTKSRWIAVDPTWESTTGGVNYFDKLDTNHFAFVIHGSSSQWPVPAGGYKINGNETDDLKVEFNTDEVNFGPDLVASFEFQNVIGGLPSSGKVVIRNSTGRAVLTPKIKFSISGAKITSGESASESTFLPFETKTYEVKLTAGSLTNTKKLASSVTVDGWVGKDVFEKKFSTSFLVHPFFLSVNPVSILALATSGLLIFIYPPVFRKIRNRLNKRS